MASREGANFLIAAKVPVPPQIMTGRMESAIAKQLGAAPPPPHSIFLIHQ